MQTFKTLPDAIALAEFAHRNQQDKAGLPYIDHPRRVLAAVQAMGARPYVQMAAILHDVSEDTSISTIMMAEMGFSDAVTNLVNLVDKNFYVNERGFRDMEAYYAGIRANPDARMIKEADIRDNTAPWRLSYLSEETQARLTKKYEQALKRIRP
jgi:(p)ppGpp synthase/HD superfamily hydrolase